MSNFNTFIDTFIDEKGIDTERMIEAEGPSGLNMIPVAALVDMMKSAPASEQSGIQKMLVKIDFHNADPMGYFNHLAQAVAA